MGHVTCVAPTLPEAIARSNRVAMLSVSRRQNELARRMKTPSVDVAATVRAAEVLRSGGIVALPTETVYGLAADADNEDAVRKLFSAKGRPPDHPVIVHVSGVDAFDDWAKDVPDEARVLARTFWPGPLTLVLRRSTRVRDIVTGGQDTVGLRSPAHPWMRRAACFRRRIGGAERK